MPFARSTFPVRFTRSTYPDIPGMNGSPCWTVRGPWFYFDADWNTRPPFGACLAVRIGPQPAGMSDPNMNPGFTLDLNAPIGEPNRLYLFLPYGWHVVLGLPEFRDFRVTSVEENPGERVRRVVHGEHYTNWLRPHIAGISRYRYHRVGDDWVRDDKPAPGHWGWLTVTRHFRRDADAAD